MENPHTAFERVRIFLLPITGSKLFDKITGFISLLNPFALIPQLYNCIVMENPAGVSTSMYILFILLQTVFALVAVKAKNAMMFISMLISILISMSIIILTIFKGA